MRYPFPQTTDFSAFLLQAQARGRRCSASPMPGRHLNSVKQAHEFGLTKRGMKLAALLVFITDVHAIGPADRAGPV